MFTRTDDPARDYNAWWDEGVHAARPSSDEPEDAEPLAEIGPLPRVRRDWGEVAREMGAVESLAGRLGKGERRVG